jgi:uncharacterized OB-fold protein
MGKQIPMVDYLILDEGEPHLVAHACTSCGALFFDRRNGCARCGKRGFEQKRLGTKGSLRAFTIVHRAAPGVPVPFVSAIVDLDGAGVVKANLVGVEPEADNVKLGMRLKMATFTAGADDDGTEAVAFGFEPA